MKTMEDVITALEICSQMDAECDKCPYHSTAKGWCEEKDRDALYYLKMYRSDQIQWDFFHKNYEDELKQKIKDFGDAKERFIKRLQELKKQGQRKWISVSDRMPENDEIMVIRCVTKKGVVTWNRAWYDGQFWHGSGSFAEVTHWMPISTDIE